MEYNSEGYDENDDAHVVLLAMICFYVNEKKRAFLFAETIERILWEFGQHFACSYHVTRHRSGRGQSQTQGMQRTKKKRETEHVHSIHWGPQTFEKGGRQRGGQFNKSERQKRRRRRRRATVCVR